MLTKRVPCVPLLDGSMIFSCPCKDCFTRVDDSQEFFRKLGCHFETTFSDYRVLVRLSFDSREILLNITSFGFSLFLGMWDLGIYSKTLALKCCTDYANDELNLFNDIVKTMLKDGWFAIIIILMACHEKGWSDIDEGFFEMLECKKGLYIVTLICHALEVLTLNFRRDGLYFLLDSHESRWHLRSDTTALFHISNHHLPLIIHWTVRLNWIMHQLQFRLTVLIAIATIELVEGSAAASTSTFVQAMSTTKVCTSSMVISLISCPAQVTCIFGGQIFIEFIGEAATICLTLWNDRSCNLGNNFLAIGMNIGSAVTVPNNCSFLYPLIEVLILLKSAFAGRMAVVVIGLFLPRRCWRSDWFSTILLYKVKAEHWLYLFAPLFSWDLFDHGSLDLCPVAVVLAPRLRLLHKITGVISMSYPNLEGKVLIEGGSIVMNRPTLLLLSGLVDDSLTKTQPKINLSVFIWDPGPSNNELKGPCIGNNRLSKM